jgi:tRNA nucleotidyltransferase (CCA-adding enzyme)
VLALARSVDSAAVSAEAIARGASGPAIGEALHAARAAAVAQGLADQS